MKPTPATSEELERIQDKLTRENGYNSDHERGHTENSQEYLAELYEMMKDCEKQAKRFQEVLSKYKP